VNGRVSRLIRRLARCAQESEKQLKKRWNEIPRDRRSVAALRSSVLFAEGKVREALGKRA